MKRIEIENDFHNTVATIIPKKIVEMGAFDWDGFIPVIHLTKSQKSRAWRALCGIEECGCSSRETAGMRTSKRVMICETDFSE